MSVLLPLEGAYGGHEPSVESVVKLHLPELMLERHHPANTKNLS
jgi:hypothetical protein